MTEQALLTELKILVVDDDPYILELLGAFLDSRGHDVTLRESGTKGLETVKETEFDLVFSDVHMAGVNGFELLKATRAMYPEIGFVLMTAYEECYPLSQALEGGADGYVSKPFTLSKFSLIFERAYWTALSRQDWWDKHAAAGEEQRGTYGF